MDARIQAAIDDITATKSLETKAAAAIALQGTQIIALQQQIAAIQAKGDIATSADLDMLKAAADGLVASNAALAAALPVPEPTTTTMARPAPTTTMAPVA